MQYSAKILPNNRLALSPLENPASATAYSFLIKIPEKNCNEECSVDSLDLTLVIKQAGADPGFPVGGGANPQGRGRQHTNLQSQKLHEIKKILVRRGGAPPWIRHCTGWTSTDICEKLPARINCFTSNTEYFFVIEGDVQ